MDLTHTQVDELFNSLDRIATSVEALVDVIGELGAITEKLVVEKGLVS